MYKSNKGKSFTQEEAIDLMVSLSAIDANSENKWKGFLTHYQSLNKKPSWISIGKFD